MANNTATNPIVIDTWTSDITITAYTCMVKKIVLLSADANDILYLENAAGDQVCNIVQKHAGGTTEIDFGQKGQVFQGLQIDVSDCTGLGSGDKVWIYLR